MKYDITNGAGFMSGICNTLIIALNSGLAINDPTRQAAYNYVVIPILLISIVAVIIIFAQLFFPNFFPRSLAVTKKMFTSKKKPTAEKTLTDEKMFAGDKTFTYGETFTAKKKLTAKNKLKRPDYKSLDQILQDTGFTYDPRQDMFYSVMDGWQRNFGYCRLYDETAAPSSMIIDCEPVYFEYAGKRWLIELWKGQYGMTTGCEIGVFATTGPDLDIPGVFNGTFYYNIPDEDRLQMSFVLKKNKAVLLAREEKHWWLTAFKLAEFSEPAELAMDVDITLKDDEMRDAFVDGLKYEGYTDNEMIIKGDTVSLKYVKPHSPQPITRTPATDWIVQRKNELLCEKYRELTDGSPNMADKIKVIEKKAPELLGEIVNIRKTRQTRETHEVFKDYLNDDRFMV
jgi:hypothetical protein